MRDLPPCCSKQSASVRNTGAESEGGRVDGCGTGVPQTVVRGSDALCGTVWAIAGASKAITARQMMMRRSMGRIASLQLDPDADMARRAGHEPVVIVPVQAEAIAPFDEEACPGGDRADDSGLPEHRPPLAVGTLR